MVSNRAFVFHIHVTCIEAVNFEILTLGFDDDICLVRGHLCFITHLVHLLMHNILSISVCSTDGHTFSGATTICKIEQFSNIFEKRQEKVLFIYT
jgi:hypothetical protein